MKPRGLPLETVFRIDARLMKNSCLSNLEDEPKWKLVFVHFILACTRCGERRLTPSCRILQNLEFGKLHLDSL